MNIVKCKAGDGTVIAFEVQDEGACDFVMQQARKGYTVTVTHFDERQWEKRLMARLDASSVLSAYAASKGRA